MIWMVIDFDFFLQKSINDDKIVMPTYICIMWNICLSLAKTSFWLEWGCIL
jgi:hypothetical protein